MAPQTPKTSFKSYEVQARLLRAIVAAHPEVKWNFKAIVTHYGSDISVYSIQHHFRRIKTQAEIIRLGLAVGYDPATMILADSGLPKDQNGIEKRNIAKYFGESTADGIQFQFRAIKKDANAMRSAVDTGTSPIKAIALTTPSTTRRRTVPSSSTPSTCGGTLRTPSTAAPLGTIAETGVSSALGNMTVKREFLQDDADQEPDPEATPTRPPHKKKRYVATSGVKMGSGISGNGGSDVKSPVKVEKKDTSKGRGRSGLSVPISPSPGPEGSSPPINNSWNSRQTTTARAKAKASFDVDLTETDDEVAPSSSVSLPPSTSTARESSPFKASPVESFSQHSTAIPSSSQGSGSGVAYCFHGSRKRRRVQNDPFDFFDKEEDINGNSGILDLRDGHDGGGSYSESYMGYDVDEDGAI